MRAGAEEGEHLKRCSFLISFFNSASYLSCRLWVRRREEGVCGCCTLWSCRVALWNFCHMSSNSSRPSVTCG